MAGPQSRTETVPMFDQKQLSQQEILAFLNCRRLPGRLTTGQTAALVGCQEHEIPILVASRQLKPLGNPKPNAPKYFAAIAVEAVASDPKWLSKATLSISDYWKNKNAKKAATRK